MTAATQIRSAVDRDDAAIAVVEEVSVADGPQEIAAAVVAQWESGPWPNGLVAQSLFVSTDGTSLLTYSQWSSAEELERHAGVARPDWRVLGVEPGAPRAYELYRVVRPTALPDPMPSAQCFPAAFFAMDSGDAARRWVDGLLDTEERNEGEDREYPGALAANFHVAADGSGIFLLSEWASEAEAVDHIEAVIVPLLEYMGQAEAGAGSRYTFHTTVSAAPAGISVTS